MARKSFYVIVPLLSTILTLVCVEASFELFYPIPYSLERDSYYGPDQFTGYKLNPNFNPDGVEYFQHGIVAKTNSHGHRDDEVSLAHPPDVFRLLVLGDSFTMGANVPQDKVYPQRLEKLLNTNSTIPIEVINTAVGGWQPFQYAQYYEHYGRKFKPDAILIGFFVGNDTYDPMNSLEQTRTAVMGRRVSREAAARRSIRFKIFMYEHSHIVRLVMNRKRPVTVDFSRKDCQDFSTQYLTIQQARLRNYLKRDERRYQLAQNSVAQILQIKALADEENIPLVVLLIPDETQINPSLRAALLPEDELSKFDFGMPQSMLKEIVTQNDIQVVDLMPAFLADPQCLYMNDTHWAVVGHELAATVIYEKLINDNLIPNLTARLQPDLLPIK